MQASLLTKIQMISSRGFPTLTVSSSVVVALVGIFALPRSVVKKLEDAEMPLQVTVGAVPIISYSDRNRSGIYGPRHFLNFPVFTARNRNLSPFRNSAPVWWPRWRNRGLNLSVGSRSYSNAGINT